jgi:predicted DNA-binding ribbon-helix-helix protein
VRSVRLPVAEWRRLEREARRSKISVNALIAARLGRAS